MKFLGGFNFEAKERKIGNVAYVTSVSFKSNESKCLFRLKVVIYIFVYRNSILGDICQKMSKYIKLFLHGKGSCHPGWSPHPGGWAGLLLDLKYVIQHRCNILVY